MPEQPPTPAGPTELQDSITEENIEVMVYTFYSRIRRHDTLGPVFNDRLEGRWKLHQENMVDFWSNVFLRTGRYFGNPLIKHRNVKTIERWHFAEWLDQIGRASRRDRGYSAEGPGHGDGATHGSR